MIDVVHEINAVQRRVGSRVLEAGEARGTGIGRGEVVKLGGTLGLTRDEGDLAAGIY